ncbi:MAG: LAGLIDADG family homing endonuclease [Candidatus Aenigmarchaeota archaeon]|nr:LAGLIDADG family homing endonuclease [Candidatus Aenigmarchaeota archaeon]
MLEIKNLMDLEPEERMKLYNEAMLLHQKFGFGIIKISKKLQISPSTIYGWVYKGCKPSKHKRVKFTKKLLEKLYVKNQLSLRKISEILGVDERTVRYWLMKFGIPTRPSMILLGRLRDRILTKKRLITLYVKRQRTIREIAEKYGLSYEAVRQRLLKHGIKRRDVQFRTKYSKAPFSGDPIEASYLLGLRAGDLTVNKRSSKRIRISVSTTHPAMIELMHALFDKYGKVMVIPRKPPQRFKKRFLKARTYSWEVYVDVNSTFDFLIEKPKTIPSEIMRDVNKFLAFFAGYFDAEGYVKLSSKPMRKCIYFILRVKSKDKGILDDLYQKLKEINYNPILSTLSSGFTELSITHKNEFFDLLQKLPLHHREKIEVRDLALWIKDKKWADVVKLVRNFRQKIKEERAQCIREAKLKWLSSH